MFFYYFICNRNCDLCVFKRWLQRETLTWSYIVWNTHARIESSIAIAHIQEWSSLTPAITDIESKYLATSIAKNESDDLDTVDELAIRSLLLGIVHRTLAEYTAARAFLLDALERAPDVEISSWVGGVSAFELAVLDLKEAEVKGTNMKPEEAMTMWEGVLAGASEKLDQAYAMSTKQMDLSSRLDSRIVMLRDEIFDKRGLLGLPAWDNSVVQYAYTIDVLWYAFRTLHLVDMHRVI